MKKKHFLITGGAGFVGSHLADLLIKKGYEVTVYDCLLPQVHGSNPLDKNGWPTYLNKKAHRIKGDIITGNSFKQALKGITHLVHLAASVGVGQSMVNIVEYTNNNSLAAAVVLEQLAKGNHTIERIAVASSMSIYGEGEYYSKKRDCVIAPDARGLEQLKEKKWDLYDQGEVLIPIPTTEKKALKPASIYAINKRDHEEMFLVVGRALEIPTIALRLFNIYGSHQALGNPYTGVAAIFISRLLNDLPPLIFEDGKQQRDFVHVSDAVRAFTTVLLSENRIWDVYNVGSGKPITIYEMAKSLAKFLKKDIKPEILENFRMGDIRHCFSNIQKIEKEFGFKPEKDFNQGMMELIEWVKKCPKPTDYTLKSLMELKQNKLIL